LFLDANINAQQTAAAANQRLMFSTNNTPDLSTSSDNLFPSDCENPSEFIHFFSILNFCSFSDDLLNDNTNMSTVSLSSKISFVQILQFHFPSFSYYRQCCIAE
jgi:hypothetical protein